MQIVGIGTDITECPRIGRMILEHGEQFLHRVYTEREIEYCSARKLCTEHFAGRWAAKEAVLKAIGTGWVKGVSWREIEILNKPGGAPEVILHGGTREFVNSRGVDEIMISISHCRAYATAYAVALAATTIDPTPESRE